MRSRQLLRRTGRGVSRLVFVLALSVAACGGSTTAVSHHSLKGLVLTEVVGGDYVPGGYAFLEQLPQVAVFADGHIFSVPASSSNFTSDPALLSIVERDVPVGMLNRIVNDAVAAGVTSHPPDLGRPPITDLATTTFTLTADGHTWMQSAYALGSSEGLTSDQLAARRRLEAFSTVLARLSRDLGGGSAVHPYKPASLSVFAVPATVPIARSATVEQWPLEILRGLPPGQSECVAVVGRTNVARVVALAARATTQTIWANARRRWQLVFRPDLPGAAPCA
jgi:hypothetical protein